MSLHSGPVFDNLMMIIEQNTPLIDENCSRRQSLLQLVCREFFCRVYATLYVTMSVGWSVVGLVGWSVGRLVGWSVGRSVGRSNHSVYIAFSVLFLHYTALLLLPNST